MRSPFTPQSSSGNSCYMMLTCCFHFLLRLGISFELLFMDFYLSASGFLLASVSPDGRYFISHLTINGSALESIFSVLKHTSGGNLSAINYSPTLGRLISRKSSMKNKNSERGHRDVTLNLGGSSIKFNLRRK